MNSVRDELDPKFNLLAVDSFAASLFKKRETS